MSIYLTLVTQELTHNTDFVAKNPVLNTVYNWIAKPITHTLDLSYQAPHDLYRFGFFAILYAIVLWFALVLPDIDSANSTLGRHVPFIENTVGHRTIFHSIVPLVLFAVAIAATTGVFQHCLMVLTFGYWLHLAEDAWSKSGINWFVVPIKRRFNPIRYEVGGLFERVVFAVSSVANLALFAIILYQVFAIGK